MNSTQTLIATQTRSTTRTARTQARKVGRNFDMMLVIGLMASSAAYAVVTFAQMI